MSVEKITKTKEFNQDDLFNEDFDENQLTNSLKGSESDTEYDFSFHFNREPSEDCILNTKKYLIKELKNVIDKQRLDVLIKDLLSKGSIDGIDTKDVLRREIINSENYLNGVYKSFNDDPDYKQF
jgi:hypothetical protein